MVLSPAEQTVAGGGGGLCGGGGRGAAEQVEDALAHRQPDPSDVPIARHVAELVPLPSGHAIAAGTQEHAWVSAHTPMNSAGR